MRVCNTDRLYHYLLGGADALPGICARGLLPLSAMPESPRWRTLEQVRPGFHREIYALFAEPVLGRPYRHSDVFFTPLDFRRLPDLALPRDPGSPSPWPPWRPATPR
ncbi:MAG TPA: hypothetical protein VFW96_07335 [Thermomicrobiales bacterium]|nr:hypothetical protein [Thermomicrobiales bacterium]